MESSNEERFRQKLITELDGIRHNLYSDSCIYQMTLQVLFEAKRTEIRTVDLLFKYADYFANSGISVYEIWAEVI